MRVHWRNISDERPAPSAFREHEGGNKAHCRPGRQIPLQVTHTPIVENQAHTDVTEFDNPAEARVKLARIAVWIIEWPRGPVNQ